MPFNLGIGGAVQSGLQVRAEHGYDVAVQVDGDGQHDPAEIRELLATPATREPRLDMVTGSRFLDATTGYRSSSRGALGHPHLLASCCRDRRPARHRPDVGLPA